MLCVKAPNSELPPKAGTGMLAGMVHLKTSSLTLRGYIVGFPCAIFLACKAWDATSRRRPVIHCSSREHTSRWYSPKESQHRHDGVLVKPV